MRKGRNTLGNWRASAAKGPEQRVAAEVPEVAAAADGNNMKRPETLRAPSAFANASQ